MPYETLLRDGRIRPHDLRDDHLRSTVRSLLDLGRRELEDSMVEVLSLDGRYEHAYASVRALSEVVMAAEGFRPAGGPGQHQVLFDFLRRVPTAQWHGEAQYLDACRQRRNTVAYRQAGVVTETELTDLVAEASRFGRAVRDWLSAEHPGLVPEQCG